ncbi:MAG: nickel-dependent hydrogenase large subunit [Senegalimassilia faecalis]
MVLQPGGSGLHQSAGCRERQPCRRLRGLRASTAPPVPTSRGLSARLKAFAENGQLSIFSGNWFDCKDADGASAFHLTPAENLVGTAHYFEGIDYQAKASQICAIIGGKMPHVMTSIPGGTSFVPTPEKLDEIIFRIRELKTWIQGTMIPDMFMIVQKYPTWWAWARARVALSPLAFWTMKAASSTVATCPPAW